jgi:hypothetical protein
VRRRLPSGGMLVDGFTGRSDRSSKIEQLTCAQKYMGKTFCDKNVMTAVCNCGEPMALMTFVEKKSLIAIKM